MKFAAEYKLKKSVSAAGPEAETVGSVVDQIVAGVALEAETALAIGARA